MVDVAAGVHRGHHHDVLAEGDLDFAFEAAHPVGGDEISADGVAVLGEVDGERGDASFLLEGDDVDLAVEVAFGLDDVGIELAGVGDDGAVLHPVAADEAAGILVDRRELDLAGGEVVVSAFDRHRDLRRGGDEHGFDVVVGLGRSGVGVGGAENEVLAELQPFGGDRAEDPPEERLGDAAQVEADDAGGDAVEFEEDRAHLDLVVDADVGALVEVAGETDAAGRGDDLFGDADVQHFFRLLDF